MRKQILKYFVMILSVVLIFLNACSKSPQLDPLKPVRNTCNKKIALDGRYWRSMYQPNNAFELRFTNNMNVETGDCSILLNNKYKHGIKGLQCKKNNENMFLINESESINPGESITIAFNNESGNRELFEIKANQFFKPETVGLIIGKDTLIWEFNLSLRESFF